MPEKKATFRYYAELNNLLLPEQRHKDIPVTFKGRQSVKHLIESMGIPHTEIDLILANGKSVKFSYIAENGDKFSIYPVFETLDISPTTQLRPKTLRDPKFVLDGHLGKLVSYLRMLGFDSVYRNDMDDAELAKISVNENRILLTRDRGLLKRDMITHGCLIQSRDPKEQLLSVIQRFDLFSEIDPFTRCMTCNGMLLPVKKSEIIDHLESKTKKYYQEFKGCNICGKIFWKGSHHEKMTRLIEWIEVNKKL